MRIPSRHAPLLFAFLMSGTMAFVMSGLLTALNRGLGEGFLMAWLRSDLIAWALAFPLVTVLAPRVRQIVARVTCEAGAAC